MDKSVLRKAVKRDGLISAAKVKAEYLTAICGLVLRNNHCSKPLECGIRLMARTFGFQPENEGSTPLYRSNNSRLTPLIILSFGSAVGAIASAKSREAVWIAAAIL